MDPQQVPTTSSLLSPPDLTPLEQEVLDEYERLAENMRKVSLTPPPHLSPYSIAFGNAKCLCV